jgi:hypothetical protein
VATQPYEQKEVVKQYEQKEVTRIDGQDLPIPDECHRRPEDDAKIGTVRGRIFGMKRTNFWLCMVAGVILVVAAVVGGIAGGHLTKKKHVEAHEFPKFCC